MGSAAAFWDKRAEGYARRPIKDMAAYDRTLERVRAHLPADAEVLEVGCGTGSTALRLAGDARRITATDVAEKMLAIGRRKAAEQGIGNVEFTRLDLPAVAPAGGPYDVVLAFNLLHLIEDRAAAIRQLRAAVKPGGLFISKTVCLGESGAALRLMVRLMRLVGVAPYVGFSTIAALEALVAEAGFEIVETGNYPASPPSRFIVARRTDA